MRCAHITSDLGCHGTANGLKDGPRAGPPSQDRSAPGWDVPLPPFRSPNVNRLSAFKFDFISRRAEVTTPRKFCRMAVTSSCPYSIPVCEAHIRNVPFPHLPEQQHEPACFSVPCFLGTSEARSPGDLRPQEHRSQVKALRTFPSARQTAQRTAATPCAARSHHVAGPGPGYTYKCHGSSRASGCQPLLHSPQEEASTSPCSFPEPFLPGVEQGQEGFFLRAVKALEREREDSDSLSFRIINNKKTTSL